MIALDRTRLISPLIFFERESAMKTCALVAASEFNAEQFMRMYTQHAFDAVVAVDGGYAHLISLGVQPDAALGDFDSLGYVPTEIPVITYPEVKDDSDLALALDWAMDEGFSRICVFGAFAQRLDHTLAALQVFRRAAKAGLAIYGVSQDAFLSVFVPGVEYYFSAKAQPAELMAGDKSRRTLSLISLEEQALGVTIEGLKYETSCATITNTQTLGLSNEFTGKPVTISLQSGLLLCIWPLSVGIPHIFSTAE